jgi:hypothetical protein
VFAQPPSYTAITPIYLLALCSHEHIRAKVVPINLIVTIAVNLHKQPFICSSARPCPSTDPKADLNSSKVDTLSSGCPLPSLLDDLEDFLFYIQIHLENIKQLIKVGQS